MGVLSESLCFCKGVGKSERMKAAIFTTKSPAMAQISGAGTGFLIHRNLLLTTHANLPSIAAAESAEIQLQNVAFATLFPHRFSFSYSKLPLILSSSVQRTKLCLKNESYFPCLFLENDGEIAALDFQSSIYDFVLSVAFFLTFWESACVYFQFQP